MAAAIAAPVPMNTDQKDTETNGNALKRKLDSAGDVFHKSTLCKYFRKEGKCIHGEGCRFAHGEEDLRPRPDNTWDPSSHRAKKQKEDEKLHQEEALRTCPVNDLDVRGEGKGDSGEETAPFNKCVLYLPKRWNDKDFSKFLKQQNLTFVNAKKRSGMVVGFVGFSTEEDVTLTIEKLNGYSLNKRSLKVADVLQHSSEKKNVTTRDKENDLTDQAQDLDSFADKPASKPRSARDAVTPLAHMSYDEQLIYKKGTISQLLKKLSKNARKARPHGSPLPDWVASAKSRGGLPCNLEGILSSPIVNGYRNKCEFTVGLSKEGERVVGFLLGNFREGVTIVEEPTDCPNVSKISCQYAAIFQNFVRSSQLPIWDKYKNTGFWRLFAVREGRSPKSSELNNEENHIGEVMLIVQVCSKGVEEEVRAKEFRRMAEALVLGAAEASPQLPLTTLLVQDHLGISNVASADAPLIPIELPASVNRGIDKQREPEIYDYIHDLRFRISPTAFFQVNTVAAERLYSLAGDWAALTPTTLLFDICCGTGTIGLTLAKRAGLVIGIEMSAPAVSDAKRNAEINGIENCKFICAKAEDVIESLLEEYVEMPVAATDDTQKSSEDASDNKASSKPSDNSKVDVSSDVKNKKAKVSSSKSARKGNKNIEKTTSTESTKRFKEVVVIVDPPRSGLHPTVIKALRTHPLLRHIVYISCNPETLVANAIELCTPTDDSVEKTKQNKGVFKFMSSLGHARHRLKNMPMSEPFIPVKAMAVDLFPHTSHCEMVMLFER